MIIGTFHIYHILTVNKIMMIQNGRIYTGGTEAFGMQGENQDDLFYK